MALVTRTLTNAGAPLYSPDGDLLVGVKINFQLMDTGGRPSDAWDATTNERVGGDVIVATTDTAGVFSVDLWPNTRGNRATKYKCRVQFEGFREFSGIVEDVPGVLLWVDFMLGGAVMVAQDMSAISVAIASHVASPDPHTQYAKEADLGTAALLDVGTATGTVAAGDDARLLAVADKVDKIAGKGLSTEDYSTAEKSKLAGIATGATANATDAQLRDRTTHTGAQAISTVTGLQGALDALVPQQKAAMAASGRREGSRKPTACRRYIGRLQCGVSGSHAGPDGRARRHCRADGPEQDFCAQRGAGVHAWKLGRAALSDRRSAVRGWQDRRSHAGKGRCGPWQRRQHARRQQGV